MKRILLFIGIAIVGTMVQAQVFEWANQFEGGGNSSSYTMALAPSGDIYVAGSFMGTIDFDPGDGTFFLTAFGDRDTYITKLDALGNFIWAKQIGGTDADYSRRITLDPIGNVYVTGSFKGTADMDPGDGVHNFTSLGGEDMFVTELDENGSFIWAGHMGGTLDDHVTDIVIPPSGDIYMAGYFLGEVDFDPADTADYYLTGVSQALFVEKLSSDHTFLWAGTMGGPGFDYCQSMCLDENENVYTTGMFMGPDDFDPGEGTAILNSVGEKDIFISKLNSDGEYVWAISMGGFQVESGQGIDYDDNGNIYFAGNFQGAVDFSTNGEPYILTSLGGYDTFVGKLDVDGNLIWIKQIGGIGGVSAYAMTLDNNGNSYTTGLFEGTADFNPGEGTYDMTSFGDYDVFVSRLNSSGNFVWAADMGGTQLDRGFAIKTDELNDIYTTGLFTGIADFDPSDNVFNLTGSGEYNAFMVKLGTELLSVDSKYLNTRIKLFPNPVNQEFNIDFENTLSEVTIRIYNILGQEVFNELYFSVNDITIEFNNDPGIYFVKIISENADFEIVKIVKE